MGKPEIPAYASKTEEATAYLLNKFGRSIGEDTTDYAQLVKPEAWLNTFLATEDLDRLRALDVSWENGKIQRLLGDHVAKMKEAGVELAEDPHGFIVFRTAK